MSRLAVISVGARPVTRLLKRIESEWIAMGTTPTLEHPICWFGLKRSEPV